MKDLRSRFVGTPDPDIETKEVELLEKTDGSAPPNVWDVGTFKPVSNVHGRTMFYAEDSAGSNTVFGCVFQ